MTAWFIKCVENPIASRYSLHILCVWHWMVCFAYISVLGFCGYILFDNSCFGQWFPLGRRKTMFDSGIILVITFHSYYKVFQNDYVKSLRQGSTSTLFTGHFKNACTFFRSLRVVGIPHGSFDSGVTGVAWYGNYITSYHREYVSKYWMAYAETHLKYWGVRQGTRTQGPNYWK